MTGESVVVGRQIGSYRVLSRLGAGGMGEVYRARDLKLGRDVAIKVLPSAFTQDAERLARFEREARLLATLNHPHICTIYEIGEADDLRFIAMELIDGRTLAEEIATQRVELRRGVLIVLEIAGALGKAHEAGITHRDVKPDNILISRDGYAKIVDFGLAKLDESFGDLAATVSDLSTHAGMIFGTIRYMSPEQALGRPTDSRGDVFSLGLVLYEVVTGEYPYREREAVEIMYAIIHQPLPQDRLASLPPALTSIIDKATRKKPDDRYRSAKDFAADLRLAYDQLGTHAFEPVDRTDSLSATSRIAVLPFENLSRDPADAWLAGAFSDSLTYGLRSLKTLVLIHTERIIEAYRDCSPAGVDALDAHVVRKVSEHLGVHHYVHGTYQRIAGQIRVIARLVETKTAAITAQESVTGAFADLLKLQDDLARSFADALETGALPGSRSLSVPIEAYQLLIEGQDLYASGKYYEASERLRAAVARHSRYAEGWALLGKAEARLAAPAAFTRGSVEEHQKQALRAARKAVELAPGLYDAHMALALAHRESSHLEQWRAETEQAIQLNPRIAEGHALLGDSYSAIPTWGCARDRDPRRAEECYRRALQIDPKWYAAHTSLMTELNWTARFEDALQAGDEALKLVPGHPRIRMYRAVTLMSLGRLDEAEREMNDVLREGQASALDQVFLGAMDLKRSRREQAGRRLEAVLAVSSTPVILLLVAYYYFDSGDVDEGIAYLRRACQLDRGCTVFLATSPVAQKFIHHPAVAAMLAEFGMPKRI